MKQRRKADSRLVWRVVPLWAIQADWLHHLRAYKCECIYRVCFSNTTFSLCSQDLNAQPKVYPSHSLRLIASLKKYLLGPVDRQFRVVSVGL